MREHEPGGPRDDLPVPVRADARGAAQGLVPAVEPETAPAQATRQQRPGRGEHLQRCVHDP